MDSVFLAIEHARPIWQQAVYHLNWSHGLVAFAYGVASWFCFLNVHVTKSAQEASTIWWVATLLMCFLGANVLLQGDVFVTQLCRSLARSQGWYGHRREWQYLVIGVLVLAGLGFGFGVFQRFGADAQNHSGAVGLGLVLLLVLLAVRTVSAHGTDAVIQARFAGISMGRFLEAAGIAWVLSSALRHWRQPSATTKVFSRVMGRHV